MGARIVSEVAVPSLRIRAVYERRVLRRSVIDHEGGSLVVDEVLRRYDGAEEEPATAVAEALRDAVADLAPGPRAAVPSLPEISGLHHLHRLPVGRLLVDPDAADARSIGRNLASVAAVGGLLAPVHRLPPHEYLHLGWPPSCLVPVAALLDGEDDILGGSPDAMARVRGTLSTRSAAVDRVTTALRDGSARAVLHGSPGLGWAWLGEDGSVHLMGWRHLSIGPPAHDLGMLLGDLAEVATRADAAADEELVRRCVDAGKGFLAAYGDAGGELPAGSELVATATARIVLHWLEAVSRYGYRDDYAELAVRALDQVEDRIHAMVVGL